MEPVRCVVVSISLNRLNREFETDALNCVTYLNTLPTLIYLETRRST
jgi:hypothetical protein